MKLECISHAPQIWSFLDQKQGVGLLQCFISGSRKLSLKILGDICRRRHIVHGNVQHVLSRDGERERVK